MKHPNVNRKYNYQIYIQTSTKVFASITKLIITPTSRLKHTYPVHGVPQGTILRPLNFVFTRYIYKNDLPNCFMHSQPRMYADDTSITYASNDVEEIERCVNIDLDRIRILYVLQRTNLH